MPIIKSLYEYHHHCFLLIFIDWLSEIVHSIKLYNYENQVFFIRFNYHFYFRM
jgi:hypothetical protein